VNSSKATSSKMTFSKSVLLAFTVISIATLVACGGSSSSSSSTPPPSNTTPSVALSTTPNPTPASLTAGGNLSVTATVTNDSKNGGVAWSVACGNTTSGGCGTFSAAQSASGTAVTYTAPVTAPPAKVVITATVVDDTSVVAATAGITINAITGASVMMTTPPPFSLAPSTTAGVAATVSNDAANAGVTWSCSPSSTCGSFNPTSTASAATTVYTPGSARGNVVVTATSVSDSSQNASSTVTVTTAAGLQALTPNANYVFAISGQDSTGSPFHAAGVFTVGSNGTTITTGEQDFADFNTGEHHDTISSGTIAASSTSGDPNLTITLQTGDPCLGPGSDGTCNSGTGSGAEALDLSPVSVSTGLLTEYDTWATAKGTLELQSSSLAIPSGGYAFWLNMDPYPFYFPIAFGGVLNVDNAGGTGNISGNGSIFDIGLMGAGSVYTLQSVIPPSVVTGPDPLGLVTFNIYSGGVLSAGSTPSLSLLGYMVDSGHIRFVEDIGADSLGIPMGGSAASQTGTGTFSSSSISGSTYVFGTTGNDNSSNGYVHAAGALTFNADGSVTGNVSFNDLDFQSPQGGSVLAAEVAATPCSSGTAVTPCYTIDASGTGADGGTGRVTITNLTDSTTTPLFNYNLELYLDGNGHAMVISLDLNDLIAGTSSQQTGSFTPATFSGTYATNAGGVDITNFDEFESSGQIIANGLEAFEGTTDLNWIYSSGPTFTDESVDGNMAQTGAGIYGGYIGGLDLSTCPVYGIGTTGCSQDAFTFYFVDSTKAVAIENDANQLTLGTFELQQ
jgi:hypothetical protein